MLQVSDELKRSMTKAAKAALAAGVPALTRVVGGDTAITMGKEYVVNGIDYRTAYFQPTSIDDETWEKMSEAQRQEQGNARSWFELTTNQGALSFSAVIGRDKAKEATYWAAGELETGVTVANLFKATQKTPEAWMAMNCDGIMGRTLRCVGTKEDKSGRYTVKDRVFVLK